ERFFPRTAPGAGPCSVSVVSSPSDAQQPIRVMFWLTMANARRRLWICNSYFIPDPRLRKAVVTRARRGGDVRIRGPGNHTAEAPVQLAGRSNYEELLKADARIYELQAAMMHDKTIVADDTSSVLGSANMDERSMEMNEENIIGVAAAPLARAIAEGM